MPETTTKLTPQQKAEQAAAEFRTKLEARANELRGYIGKRFVPKVKNPRLPNQTLLIVGYGGVQKLVTGQQAHVFQVSSENPSYLYTPPATQFLADHEPYVEPEKKPEQAQEKPINMPEVI